MQECGVILKLLKDYEMVSWQQINFSKSSVQFGHTVPEGVRLDIHNLLGITNIGGLGNYFGIPESLGGSKTQIFGFLNERVNSKVNSWTVRFLTRGGREVLIKSSASPMQTFVMSCFRLFKGVTKKNSSTLAHFWLSSGNNKKGNHWVSWDKA